MNRRNLLSSLTVVGTGLALGAGQANDLYADASIELNPVKEKALRTFQNNLESAHLISEGHRSENDQSCKGCIKKRDRKRGRIKN